jgi:peroxiredoxin
VALFRAAVLLPLFSISFSALASEFRTWNAAEPPRFALQDTNGSADALDAGHAPVTLVHFFATWCEPCREELPALKRMVERGGSTVRLLAISVGEPDMRVQRFLTTMTLDFPVLLDRDRAVSKSWNVTTLPTTFLLDSDLKAKLVIETDYAWDRVDPGTLITNISSATEPPAHQSTFMQSEESNNETR